MYTAEFKRELWSIMFQVKSDIRRFIDKILQTEGITMMQGYILFRLSKGPISSISSASREFELNQGNLSAMCKQMEKAGLIKRTRNPADERVVNLSLTEKGEQTLERLRQYINRFDAVLEAIPKEKMELILNGLNEFNLLIKSLLKEGI